MKAFFILSMLIVSSMLGSQVQAGVPQTRLPDGEYTFECFHIDLQEVDGLGLKRVTYSTVGTSSIHHFGDKSSRKETSTTIMDGKVTGTSEDLTTASVTDLGGGLFEERSTQSFRWTRADATSSEQEEALVVRRVFEVAGQFEINLKIQVGTDPEKSGVGETVFSKTNDGAFNTISYIREPIRREARTFPNGGEIAGTKMLHQTASCTYRQK